MRRGTNVQVAYFDQQREQLDPERTVVDTVGDGNDRVTVGGRTRHVHGYLEDFLFPPERARSPVQGALGRRAQPAAAGAAVHPAGQRAGARRADQRSRPRDARAARGQLVDWPGTLLVVSHDRRFLDNVVTSTLVFEGDGRVEEYVGGYDDWLRQRPQPAPMRRRRLGGGGDARPGQHGAPAPAAGQLRKATNKERASATRCPARIEALEAEQRRLSAEVAAPDFYKKPAAEITAAMARLEAIPGELLAAYARWDELDGLR